MPGREVYRQAARASWAVSLAAVLLLTCTTPKRVASYRLAVAVLAVSGVLFLAGVTLGAFAVSGIRRHGRPGIAGNAFVGLALSGVMLILTLIASQILPGRPVDVPGTQPAATTATTPATTQATP